MKIELEERDKVGRGEMMSLVWYLLNLKNNFTRRNSVSSWKYIAGVSKRDTIWWKLRILKGFDE